MITRRTVLKKINCPLLDMELADGYIYFIYDDIANNVYETHSIYVCRMNELSLETWVEAGNDFVTKCEENLKSRNERN